MDQLTYYDNKIESVCRELSHQSLEGDEVAKVRLKDDLRNYRSMRRTYLESDKEKEK